jgi:hypothetical protein
LRPAQLAALPADLRKALHAAAFRLDRRQALEIAEKIGKLDAVVGKCLEQLAERWDFGSILSLLEGKP